MDLNREIESRCNTPHPDALRAEFHLVDLLFEQRLADLRDAQLNMKRSCPATGRAYWHERMTLISASISPLFGRSGPRTISTLKWLIRGYRRWMPARIKEAEAERRFWGALCCPQDFDSGEWEHLQYLYGQAEQAARYIRQEHYL